MAVISDGMVPTMLWLNPAVVRSSEALFFGVRLYRIGWYGAVVVGNIGSNIDRYLRLGVGR